MYESPKVTRFLIAPGAGPRAAATVTTEARSEKDTRFENILRLCWRRVREQSQVLLSLSHAAFCTLSSARSRPVMGFQQKHYSLFVPTHEDTPRRETSKAPCRKTVSSLGVCSQVFSLAHVIKRNQFWAWTSFRHIAWEQLDRHIMAKRSS